MSADMGAQVPERPPADPRPRPIARKRRRLPGCKRAANADRVDKSRPRANAGQMALQVIIDAMRIERLLLSEGMLSPARRHRFKAMRPATASGVKGPPGGRL
jgi:hypothetical protein